MPANSWRGRSAKMSLIFRASISRCRNSSRAVCASASPAWRPRRSNRESPFWAIFLPASWKEHGAPRLWSPRKPWCKGRNNRRYLDDTFRVKIGLAEMLKGGVIMDVTNAEQAVIAEKAGATSVMALERVPADIRKEGGVARMAPVTKIREIMAAVSIPVMAKARIGHFMEARILEALGVDYIDESEVLTPAEIGRAHV